MKPLPSSPRLHEENSTNQECNSKCEILAFAADICLTFWGSVLLSCSKLAFPCLHPPRTRHVTCTGIQSKYYFFACLSTTDIAWEGSLGVFLYSSVELKPFISFLIHTLFTIAISTIHSYFMWNLIWKQIRRQAECANQDREFVFFNLVASESRWLVSQLRNCRMLLWEQTTAWRYLIQPTVLSKHFCAIAFCVNSIALRCCLSTEQQTEHLLSKKGVIKI